MQYLRNQWTDTQLLYIYENYNFHHSACIEIGTNDVITKQEGLAVASIARDVVSSSTNRSLNIMQ